MSDLLKSEFQSSYCLTLQLVTCLQFYYVIADPNIDE